MIAGKNPFGFFHKPCILTRYEIQPSTYGYRYPVIHPTALVAPETELAEQVTVGPYSIIEENVSIGHHTVLSDRVHLYPGTTIGAECRIHTGAVIGNEPQDLKFNRENTTTVLEEKVTVREYVTINRGTAANGETRIGAQSLLMAYVHVAHDCRVGRHVILANSVQLAGHVVIGDFAGLGGLVPVHQFVHIGPYAFIGGGYRVAQDVPPFVLAAGEPLRYRGLNYVGLRRNAFSEDRIRNIEKAYFLIYQSRLNRTAALNRLREEIPLTSDIESIITFFEKSERGVIR